MSTVKEATSLVGKFNSDGIHLSDKTKPALKPDAKIPRMTASNVKFVERPVQSASPAQDCQNGSGGVWADNDSKANRTAYKMVRVSRTFMFSSRKKPPYAENSHS